MAFKLIQMVIKPMNFQSPPNYSDPTFYLLMNAIPKVSSYINKNFILIVSAI